MKKKVFITGGAGLIGITVTKTLLANNYSVTIYDLNEQLLRREKEIHSIKERYPSRFKYISGTIMDKYAITKNIKGADVVIHLAAMLGVKRTEENKLQCMDINVHGTEIILNACLQNENTHFIFASSSEVYGEPIENPVSETSITQGKTVYAISKLAAEELVKGYAQINDNLKFTIARFFNTYGEGQVAQFVLSKFVSRVISGKSPQINGDGKQTRTYCNALDTSDALISIIENKISYGKVYNIGNMDEKYDLINAANLVIDTLAPNSKIIPEFIEFENSDRSSNREIFHRTCNCELIMKELNYLPKISLKEGIKLIAKKDIQSNWENNK